MEKKGKYKERDIINPRILTQHSHGDNDQLGRRDLL